MPKKLYIKYIEPLNGIKAVVLPSASPANAAWSLDRLVNVWGSEITERTNKYNVLEKNSVKETE